MKMIFSSSNTLNLQQKIAVCAELMSVKFGSIWLPISEVILCQTALYAYAYVDAVTFADTQLYLVRGFPSLFVVLSALLGLDVSHLSSFLSIPEAVIKEI